MHGAVSPVFDNLRDRGMLKGVKYVQTSFDQRRLTFFRI